MSNFACIMLATDYKPEKSLRFPVNITEKLDGVPAIFTWGHNNTKIVALSRAGNRIYSCDHICKELEELKLPLNRAVVGELYNPEMSFKDISGAVRTQQPTPKAVSLKLFIYDFPRTTDRPLQHPVDEFWERWQELALWFPEASPQHCVNHLASGFRATCKGDIEDVYVRLLANNSACEGIMIRPFHGAHTKFQANWRSTGLLRKKPVNTTDGTVVSFEEAIDSDGWALAMVGAIIVSFKGKSFRIGAGKLSHPERRLIWNNQPAYIGRWLEFKSKPDASYENFREGRFYRWRPDRDKEEKSHV